MACSAVHSLQQALMTAAVWLSIVPQLHWPRSACAALKGAAEALQTVQHIQGSWGSQKQQAGTAGAAAVHAHCTDSKILPIFHWNGIGGKGTGDIRQSLACTACLSK